VLDIAPGEDFVAAIRTRLAGAQTVLVLIGPRWAGGEAPGQRRIDAADDFVRLEVAMALDSSARVVPVLLPGARMPAEADLPEPLKALARRNALSLNDTSWKADIDRLSDAIALPRQRPSWPWALAGAAVAASAVAALCWLKPWAPAEPAASVAPAVSVTAVAPVRSAASATAADPSTRLVGTWQAEVAYGWGDRHTERFDFKRHAGELTGTASFLKYPRAIDKLAFDGSNLRFETQTQQSMGSETRQLTHRYSAELRGQPPDERLAMRMQTSGAFDSHPPLEFEARRVAAPAASAGSAASAASASPSAAASAAAAAASTTAR
jgi:hypothetical protein